MSQGRMPFPKELNLIFIPRRVPQVIPCAQKKQNTGCQRVKTDHKAARVIQHPCSQMSFDAAHKALWESLEGLDCKLKALIQLFNRHSLHPTCTGPALVAGATGCGEGGQERNKDIPRLWV